MRVEYVTFPHELAAQGLYEAKVVAVRACEWKIGKGDGHVVVLNGTNFYPRGGGQPGDVGVIACSNESKDFVVEDTVMNDGVVEHFGGACNLAEGDSVVCKVNVESRIMNSRYHSAGHVIDVAMRQVGHPQFRPTRSDHTPGVHAYVKYDGKVPQTDLNDLRQSLEDRVASLISADREVTMAVETDVEKANERLFWPMDAAKLKSGARIRIISVADGDFGACGGTHVHHLADIGRIIITRVRSRKDCTTVHYRVE